jgi:NitT/TauT family transport system permease protein
MTRVRALQLALVGGAVVVVELLCRTGIIDRFTMIPPSEMLLALIHVVGTEPWFWPDVSYTLGNLGAAIALSVAGGFLLGLLVHALPRLRRVLDPIFTSYYAVPTFVLYPLLIVFFGIGPASLIVLGALFGIVAMIVATVTAIDRVPRVLLKVARVSGLGPVRTALLMKLPAASPHLMTGLRLAVAYSVIGVIAGEFILSTEGVGRRVALAYNNFDNQTMYALLVLILGFAFVVYAVLGSLEQALHRRWYRSRRRASECATTSCWPAGCGWPGSCCFSGPDRRRCRRPAPPCEGRESISRVQHSGRTPPRRRLPSLMPA